jgi:hypothetical protein
MNALTDILRRCMPRENTDPVDLPQFSAKVRTTEYENRLRMVQKGSGGV